MNELEIVSDLKLIASFHDGVNDESQTGKLMTAAYKSIENSARIILNYRKIEEDQNIKLIAQAKEIKALHAHNELLALNVKRHKEALKLHELPIKPVWGQDNEL